MLSTVTRYVADVWCLHCARMAGRLEWRDGAAQAGRIFTSAAGGQYPTTADHPRCPTCGGPVYLGEAEPVREREPVSWGPEKRGRKPRPRVT